MKTFVFFHSDLDGYVAGSIVRSTGYEAEFVKCSYGKSWRELLSPGDRICMVDFSFSPEDMLWCKEHCNTVWIDHHISAMKDS